MGSQNLGGIKDLAVRPWDDRCILPLCMLNGVLLWIMPAAEAAAAGVLFTLLFLKHAGRGSFFLFMRRWLPLCLYWGMMAAASGYLTGEADAFSAGAEACARLCLVFLLGAWMMSRSSAQRMAVAAEWHLRFFCPQSSWKIALAFSVMLRFFPDFLRRLARLRKSAGLRLQSLPSLHRMAIVFCALLRSLPHAEKKAFEAILSRRLDSPAAWRDLSPLPGLYAAATGCIAAAEILLLFFLP